MLKRILVLDDNQDILEIVQEVLSYENYDVHATSNSTGILAVAEKFNPDLVILDYRLNNASGGEICREIKSHPQLKSIPVIIFSAYINQTIDFDRYGCNAVISKPFDLSQLLDTVNNLIN